MILHLEEVHNEYNYTWEKIAPIKPVMEDRYKTSPLAHTHPSEFWKDVPRDVAKKIYMIYFMGKFSSYLLTRKFRVRDNKL